MFTIYHSNQLDLLKSLTAQLMKRQPLDAVFAQEVILVQSQGMGQWLQIQLAQELSISANIHYPFPTQFVWDIYRVFHPELPKNNTFSADFMVWVIMAILPDLAKTPSFVGLKNYFAQDDEQKHYQLASSVAGLFDQYLVYRPDWIQAWQKGEQIAELGHEQEWQGILWRALVAYSQNLADLSAHRADIHQTVLANLNNKKLTRAQKKQLPKRIFIFGIVSLPPLYLDLFNALSQHIDVHVMFMNPCRQYWGDIVDRSFIHKYVINQDTANMMLQASHPLLASWGKLGRDHLALLQHYQKQDIDAFFDYDAQSLLGLVQQSILDLQSDIIDPAIAITELNNLHKTAILTDDNSISLHVCHSEQREVEVLYDYLLATLDHDPSIALNDCVVMVADIEHYAPYIQAVFDNAAKQRYLPYTISDQKFGHIDPIIQGFSLLLELPHNRLEIDYIFDLLEIPSIAHHFNLNEESLKRLQHWIVDVGIRYELESAVDQPHSWLAGLHRMLLGYIMQSPLDSWQNVLPYDGASGLESELIGYLADFIMAIAKWRDLLSQSRTISQWQTCCLELLEAFFTVDSDSEQLLLMIQQQWQSIIEQGLLANYQAEIGITVLRSLLQGKFEQHAISHRFLIGKINFCTLMPMRSVPFKVVCLLGMNDGVYPRQVNQLGFDLIARHGRIGDRSRRNDDRYLFLEALLSAQEQLYISYIGYDIQTNDVRYPSILVDELLAYLQQHYLLSGDQELDADVAAVRLKQYLLHTHTRMPFNAQNYLPQGNNLVSYADEWLAAAKQLGYTSSFAGQLANKPITVINLDELKRFYIHPLKEFTRSRLGYVINYADEQLPTSEHFNLNGLECYHVNNQIIDTLLPQQVDDERLNHRLYQKMLHSNQLPYGAFGKILYAKQKALMAPLIERINRAKQGEFSSLDVNLNLNNIALVGVIKNIQHDGILQWRSSKLTIKDGIGLWLEHLIVCICHPDASQMHNRMYGREDTQWCFRFIPQEQARLFLSQLVEGYVNGMNQPQFMPLQSSWRWLEVAYSSELNTITSEQRLLDKAKNNFIDGFMPRWQDTIPEYDDYYQRLYPELTDELLATAMELAQIYLLPLMKNRDSDYVD